MSRYRKQQTPGDNLRDLYSKVRQWVSSALGDSSIDWDDEGDDGSSLDITVSDTTVAKYGHDGSRHGFLVPNGTGWRTVQEDAQAKADVAEADAKSYADGLSAANEAATDALAARVGDAEADIASLNSEVHGARGGYSDLDARLDNLNSRLTHLESL